MRVLVTGATGFVGGAVARHLSQRGYPVLASGRDLGKGRGLRGMDFQAADLERPGAAAALCRDCQAVVHCAARASPWGTAAQFHSGNVEATERLVAAAREAGVRRFVHISTSGVYFCGGPRLNVDEGAALPRDGQHPYVASKRRAEEVVAGGGLPYLILRPRAIYGPGDGTLLPRLVRLLSRGRLPVLGTGRNLASLTHVDHLVQVIDLALQRDPPSRVYNVSDGEPVLLWELIGRVAEQLGIPRPGWRLPQWLAWLGAVTLEALYSALGPGHEPPLTRYTLGLLTHSQTLNVTAARRELGYQPQFDTWEGVRRTLASP